MNLNREQILAFRLGGHHLDRRHPLEALLPAAGACGLQNTPPASALLALHARLEGITPSVLTTALEETHSLLLMWSLRQSPFIFPTRDAAVFTRALMPLDEAGLRHFILGAGPLVEKLGWGVGELVERVRPGLRALLADASLPFRQLSAQLADWVAADLPAHELAVWQSPSGLGPGQSLGEALVHFALRPLSVAGEFCFAPRQGDEAAFVRLDRWLGAYLPPGDPRPARMELARRYLRCYGPSTARHFAAWAGVAPHFADLVWDDLRGELVEVRLGRQPAWLLEADVARFEAGQSLPEGVRLLPPDDPYLAQRDRKTLLPDDALHSLVWRTSGRPGVLLVDGQVQGTWRPQKTGERLKITLVSFDWLAPEVRTRVEAEAASLAPLRDCTTVAVVFADPA